VEIVNIRTASLGDATYIVVSGSSAIVIDPQRDIDRFLDVIRNKKLSVTHVLETHMHNDYVSGGRSLAKQTGADLVLPAASGAGFSFLPAFHHEDLASQDGLLIRPIHTPGHTPEHTSYLVLVDGAVGAVFTGGSLLVGAAGRSDLLGDEFAHQLAVLQYGSLQRLGSLPEETGVFPTHGEGSFCTASGAGRTTSTIALEKAENPLFTFTDADSFAKNQLSGLVPYPSYYAHMGPANRLGPQALETPVVPTLSPQEAAAAVTEGARILDGRDRHSYAAGHLPGSLGIEIGDSFAPWTGWLLPFDAPIVLVLDKAQDAVAAATELGRIGFEHVQGVLTDIDGWQEAYGPLDSYREVTITDLTAAMASQPDLQVLDVRDPMEWAEGHLDGTLHHYLPDLSSGLPTSIDPSEEVWLVCRTGNRASIGAGMVESHGSRPVVVAEGGVPDVKLLSRS